MNQQLDQYIRLMLTNVLSIFARSQFFSRLIWIRKLLCFFLSANVHTLCNMAECFYLYNQQMHAVKTLLDFRYTHQTLNHNQFISRIFAWIVTGRLTVKHAQTECDQMWPDSKQNTKKKPATTKRYKIHEQTQHMSKLIKFIRIECEKCENIGIEYNRRHLLFSSMSSRSYWYESFLFATKSHIMLSMSDAIEFFVVDSGDDWNISEKYLIFFYLHVWFRHWLNQLCAFNRVRWIINEST